MSIQDAKEVTRRMAYELRREAKAAGGAAAAQDHLRDALRDFAGKTLGGYVPIRSEIDPLPVMAAWDGTVAVPMIQAAGLPLVFARWTPDTEMTNGPFGASVPAAPDYVEPAVLIVPVVAVDAWGHRLGYGGGYYDRTIARLRTDRGVTAIGFAYAAQVLETIPREGTDQRLDMLVTEDGVRRFV